MKIFNDAFLVLFIGCLAISTLSAQSDTTRMTEEDVKLEELFIEANKERILGNYDKAIDLFKNLAKISGDGAAFFFLAKTYEAKGDKDDAIESVKSAFEKEPTNEWYATFYADLLTEKGLYKEGAKVYQTILLHHQEKPEYFFNLGFLLTKANQYEAAIDIYNQIESKGEITERTARYKHSLYKLLGKESKAIEELENLVKAYPTESQYYHFLAQYYEELGKTAKALETYEAALKVDPDDPVASIAVAESKKDKGEEAGYLATLKPLFSKTEVNIDLKVKELFPYINRLPNVPEEVKTELLSLADIMCKTHPLDPKAFAINGDLLYYSGKKQEALLQYEKAIELDNTVFSVWEQLLFINAELEQFTNLIKVSEAAMDIFPNQAVVYFLNGVGYGNTGKTDEAIDALEQALMMSGRDNLLKIKILTELGVRYFSLKKYVDSDQQFEAALTLNSKDPSVLNTYSYYLALRGQNLDKALSLAKQAVEIAPDQPAFLDTYAWVFYKKADFNNAKKWSEKALEKGGNTQADILEHHGDILFQLNKTEDAVTYWLKAKEKGSKSKLLDKKISDKKLYE